MERGRYAEAQSYYDEALSLRQKLLGNEHPETAQSLANLAMLLHAKGETDEADVRYRDALGRARKALGEDHPMVALILQKMGDLALEQARAREAAEHYQSALDIRRRLLAGNHPDLAESLVGVGRARLALGELAEAETLLREGEASKRPWPSAIREGSREKRLLLSAWTCAAELRRESGAFRNPEPLPESRKVTGSFLLEVSLPLVRDLLEAREKVGVRIAFAQAGQQMPHLFPDDGQLSVRLEEEVLVDQVPPHDGGHHVPIGEHLPDVSVLVRARRAELVELLHVARPESARDERPRVAKTRFPAELVEMKDQLRVLKLAHGVKLPVAPTAGPSLSCLRC
jgi:hypothetical protein